MTSVSLLLSTLIVLLCPPVGRGEYSIYDRESFLIKSEARESEARELIRSILPHDGQLVFAAPSLLSELAFAFEIYPSSELAERIARSWENAESADSERALTWHEAALSLDGNNRRALLSIGIAHHKAGRYTTAIDHFSRVIHLYPTDLDGWFHMGLSLQHYGDIQGSAWHYLECLKVDHQHIRARINLASIHHQHGLLSDAFVHYEVLLEQFRERFAETMSNAPAAHNMVIPTTEYSMVQLNYMVALLMDGHHTKALHVARGFVTELQAAMTTDPSCVGEQSVRSAQCLSWLKDLDSAASHVYNIQKSSCDWTLLEEQTMHLVHRALEDIVQGREVTYLLPFDTLLISMTSAQRLAIAAAYSKTITLLPTGEAGGNNYSGEDNLPVARTARTHR